MSNPSIPDREKPLMLDLYCGTKSMSEIFKAHGYDVLTLDFDPKFNADFCMDIRDFKPSMLGGRNVSVIWGSPDCSAFSIASCSTHWSYDGRRYTPKSEWAKESLDALNYYIGLLNDINPKFHYTENPRGLMRKMDCMKGSIRRTVTYCSYGDDRMKPTDIWTNNATWKPRPMCHNNNPLCKHERAPRGSKTGTQGRANAKERARIPYDLCLEILMASGNDAIRGQIPKLEVYV